MQPVCCSNAEDGKKRDSSYVLCLVTCLSLGPRFTRTEGPSKPNQLPILNAFLLKHKLKHIYTLHDRQELQFLSH